MTFPFTESTSVRFGNFRRLIRLLAAGMATVFAGVSMADPVTVTLSNLAQTYDGSPKSVTVTTNPVGAACTVTYAGSTTPPTNAGSYAVVATVNLPDTGSARGTLIINQANQSITMQSLPAKTYGDPPFTATATSNLGLPVTKWQSSNPAVATISPAGEITITGAGQTSIIADFSPNYNPAWRATPLNVARAEALQSSATETVTYDGNPHGVNPATLPAGLATETTYRNTSTPEATATPQVVFQNGPDTLALSYTSTGLQATGIWGQAKYADLGGTARKLHSCDVTLVTYAGYYRGKAIDPTDPTGLTYRFKDWADAHPTLVVPPTPGVSIPGVDSGGYPIPENSGGWYHPVTLAFYEYDTVGGTESYRLLTSKTVDAFIPWRPEKLADGVTDFTNFGYAFRVPFDFPDGVILPDQVWVAVSFNTQSSGVAPIGISPLGVTGDFTPPYNALNISSPSVQQAGVTLSATKHFYFDDWRWQQAIQTRGPMLSLRTVPTNATLEPPVNAGIYEVKTQAAAFWEEGVSTSTLEIIGQTFESWRTASFATSGLPPEKTSDTADADGDGISNFLEYAFNLNPLQGDQPSPTGLEQGGATMAFTYRRNLNALNLDYSIQGSSQLADPLSWAPVTLLGEVPLSDDGATRVIQATVAKPADTPSYFLRLKAASP